MNIIDTEMMVELTIGTCDTHKGLLKYDASQIQLLDQVYPGSDIPRTPQFVITPK